MPLFFKYALGNNRMYISVILIKSEIIVPCINNELQLRLICAARNVLNAGLLVDVVLRFCAKRYISQMYLKEPMLQFGIKEE